MGASTAGTLIGQKLAPALLDRYLARTGYASQQTGEKISPDRPDNLWEPADGPDGHDFGTHGTFDDRAIDHSPQMWVSHHPALVAAAAGSAWVLAAGLGLLARRSTR